MRMKEISKSPITSNQLLASSMSLMKMKILIQVLILITIKNFLRDTRLMKDLLRRYWEITIRIAVFIEFLLMKAFKGLGEKWGLYLDKHLLEICGKTKREINFSRHIIPKLSREKLKYWTTPDHNRRLRVFHQEITKTASIKLTIKWALTMEINRHLLYYQILLATPYKTIQRS